MFALLVVVLRSSETSFGEWMVMVWRCFGKPETFHSLFAHFSLCRNFVRELLASIGVPDTANYFAKELDLFDTTVRLFFVVVGFACVLCSWVYPEHTHVLLPVQRYVALAHAQAMCLYCVCVVLEPLFFLVSVKKLDNQEMRYPYESIY